MALVLADRVQETTTTTGTGSITLAGAVPGFQSFAVVGNTNTCYYAIVDVNAWEVGIGTYSTTGPTLARTTILSNSLGTLVPITLSAGTKNVFVTYPSEKSVNLDASNNVSPLGTVASGTWQGTTIGLAYGGTGQTTANAAFNALAPSQTGNTGKYLTTNGTDTSWATNAGGDVVGPASATANGIVLFDGTTGKLIKNSASTDGLIQGMTVGLGAGAIPSNTAFGLSTLFNNTTGANNTAIGWLASAANTIGSFNTAVGYYAGALNTIGELNTTIGYRAGSNNTTGNNNTYVGAYAGNGSGATTGSSNTGVGFNVLNAIATTSEGNSIFGSIAGQSITTANNNSVFGFQALSTSTIGANNTVYGAFAMQNSTNASGNTVLGYQSGKDILTGGKNVIIGGYTGLGAPISQTGSNYIIFSDGDANVRGYFNSSGVFNIPNLTASKPVFTDASKNLVSTGTLGVDQGGTGLTTTPANGALDIGNGTGFTRTTLTAGSGVTITNASGSITINATGTGGDVVGPASATDNALARFDGTTGKLIKDSSTLTFDGTTLSNSVSGTPLSLNRTGAGTALIELKQSGTVGSYIGTSGSSDVIFFNGSAAELMRLNGTGLGIGTSSPATKLDVVGSAQIGASTAKTKFYSDTDYNGIFNGASLASNEAIYMGAGAQFFIAAGSEQMRLNSTGLGIGTSSPQSTYKLTLSGTDSVFPAVYLDNTTNSKAYSMRVTGTSWIIRDNTAGTDRLNLDSSGNLGLGVTPSAWGGATGNRAIEVGFAGSGLWSNTANNTVVTSNAYFTGSAWKYGATTTASIYQQDAGKHVWYNAPSGTAGNAITFTQAMTLDASGNLLVGTTSPLYSTANRGNITLNGASTAILGLGIAGVATGYLYTDANVVSLGAESTRSMTFAVNGSERARIDSSGNFGVGTSSPSTYGRIVSSGGTISLVTDTASQRRLSFWSTANGNSENAYIQVQNDGATTNTGEMLFATKNSGGTLAERARIDSSGNLLVGTTAANVNSGGHLFIAGADSNYYIGHSGSPSGAIFHAYQYNGTTIGSVTQSGTTAVLYNTTSDQRLKKNIQDADSASSLIDSLQVRKFDWKSDNSHQRYGFVAQELATVAPEAVHQPADPEEMMAVDYSKLVPMLVKEIQSLRKRLADAGI